MFSQVFGRSRGGGGYPSPQVLCQVSGPRSFPEGTHVLTGGKGTPVLAKGYLSPGWGYPLARRVPPETEQQSKYLPGGMPLAVTQEDFLVSHEKGLLQEHQCMSYRQFLVDSQ